MANERIQCEGCPTSKITDLNFAEMSERLPENNGLGQKKNGNFT